MQLQELLDLDFQHGGCRSCLSPDGMSQCRAGLVRSHCVSGSLGAVTSCGALRYRPVPPCAQGRTPATGRAAATFSLGCPNGVTSHTAQQGVDTMERYF